MPELRHYQDAVVLVTGGASGIGAALASALARRGATVIVADRQESLAREIAETLTRTGCRVESAALDVRDAAAFQSLVDRVFREHGRFDFLFNNAGIAHGGAALHYDLTDWDAVFDVNLRGVANGVQAVYRRMVQQGFGHIVNTASIAGLIPATTMVSYGASKHAVVGLSTALRCEAVSHGVRVSVLCPGFIRTPILHGGAFGRQVQPIPDSLAEQLWKRLRPMTAERFAIKALRAIQKNRAIIVYPWRWRLAWYLNRLSPGLGRFASRKAFEAFQRQLAQAASPEHAAGDPASAAQRAPRPGDKNGPEAA